MVGKGWLVSKNWVELWGWGAEHMGPGIVIQRGKATGEIWDDDHELM